MTRLTIKIPDDLAETLDAYPLPLPVDHYCGHALAEAATRDAERRQAHESQTGEILQFLRGYVDEEKLYSVAEAAEILGVSTRTVRGLIHGGKLPIVAIGRRQLI